MNEISKNTSLAELIRSAFSLGFGEAPPWLLEEAQRLETRLAAVEAERDAEIARVVRITERLGEEMLRAERNERILAALREPNKIVLAHVNHAYWTSWGGEDMWTMVIRAAVSGAEFTIEQPTLNAEAEREVDA